MVDFTGGCPESYSLESSKVPKNLFAILVKSYNRKSMICCSITADPYQFEAKTPMGLVMGHAYTVTKVGRGKGVDSPAVGRNIALALIRNNIAELFESFN